MTSQILSDFCTRLATGLSAMMVFTSSRLVGVQFFRTLMLVVLGLVVLAGLSGSGWLTVPGAMLSLASGLSFVGFVLWTLGRRRGGEWTARILFVVAGIALSIPHPVNALHGFLEIGMDWSSALLLGSVVGAMLLGHSYLIAPAMSIEPLLRLVVWIWWSLAARATVTALGMFVKETEAPESAGLASGSYWAWVIGARWLVGLVIPAILAWMVWQSARIRATQSATGILYAAVVLVFFGELIDEVLRN